MGFVKAVSLNDILGVISEQRHVPRSKIIGPRRYAEYTAPRQEFCYFAREFTNVSTPRIGAFLGGRDHTTVIHAVSAVKTRMMRNPDYRREIEDLRLEIKFSFDVHFIRPGDLLFKSTRSPSRSCEVRVA